MRRPLLLAAACTLQSVAMLSALEAQTTKTTAANAHAVLVLDRTHDWGLQSRQMPISGILGRELVRQALLIAARDELGLPTRDAYLSETIGGEAVPRLEITAAPGRGETIFELERGQYPVQEALDELKLPSVRDQDYRDLLTRIEAYSRQEFVELLRRNGWEGQARENRKPADVPEKVQANLREMALDAQFFAVRQLHELSRSHGDSPAILAALARGYANLGLLTECQWSPAHKVFKARSLLYVQRLTVLAPEAAETKWHRAYVAALCGWQTWALEEMAAASQASADESAAKPAAPSWSELIAAFSRCNATALHVTTSDHPDHELAQLLYFVSVEQSGQDRRIPQAAVDTLNALPHCYRVFEGAYETVNSKEFLAGLLRRCTDDIAGSIQTRLATCSELPADIKALLARDAGKETESELSRRGQLLQLLTQHSTGQADEWDRGEPSLGVLAHLLREATFIQALNWASMTRNGEVFDDDQRYLTSVAPVVERHPFGQMLQIYSHDEASKQAGIESLAEHFPWDSLEQHESRAASWLGRVDRIMRMRADSGMHQHADHTPRDLITRFRGEELRVQRALVHQLLSVSPHSPLGRLWLVRYEWSAAKDKARQWEESAAEQPDLLIALGQKYVLLKQAEDAERCLKAALKVMPSFAAYQALARLRVQAGRLDEAIALLESYIVQETDPAGVAAAQDEIAAQLIAIRQWERAKPYAEAAAEFGSDWMMLRAASVHEALQDWDRSEYWVKEASTQFPEHRLKWYLWHRRTGQGDAAEAKELAEGELLPPYELRLRGKIDKAFDHLLYYLLSNRAKEILPVLELDFQITHNPSAGLRAALAYDQLGNTKKRDEMLSEIRMFGMRFRPDPTNPQSRPRIELLALAAAITSDLASGGKAELDIPKLEKIRDAAISEEQMNFNYYLGVYLNARGKRKEAIAYWTQCMTISSIWEYNRTAAGAALWDAGITPSAYREALQKPAGKD